MTEPNQWQNTAWGNPSSTPQDFQPQEVPHTAPLPQGQPVQAPAYGNPSYAAQPQKHRGWIVGLAAVACVLILGLASIASCSALFSSLDSLTYSSPSWEETVFGDTIGIITIDGTIQYDGTTSSPEGLKAQLDAAEENPDIKAVVLRVDSGGGTATAGEEMSIYVHDFSKPVVVSSASMNASAAYEISSQADYIFTAKTTAIGAIGTIMEITDLSGLYEKLGISVEAIASAESKDSSYGNRPLTEEERAYYQAQVDQINATFVQTVAEGRSMTEDEVAALATGLTFTGIDAVKNGLADEIGTLDDAVAKACELAGIDEADTVYLQPNYSDWSSLLDIMGSTSSQGDVWALKELEDVRPLR